MRAPASLLLAAAAAVGSCQFGLPKPKLPSFNVSDALFSSFRGESPFTTSLGDAWEGVKFLDGFEPAFTPLSQPQLDDQGRFKLQPGAYKLTLHSFCGKGYSPGPSRGMGYIRAPFKGKHADIVQNVVRRHGLLMVDQHLTQELVWAILSRCKPSKFNDRLRAASVQLLTPDEIRRLEGYSLDGLSEQMMEKLLGRVDSALRPLYNAENQYRSMVSQANRPFGELERLMVLPTEESLPTTAPRARWLWSPAGYFYRAHPSGYPRTELQVVVPRKPTVVRDALGRITRLDTADTTSEVTYDDAEAPRKCPDDANLTAYPVKHVKLTLTTEGQTQTFDQDVSGFVFRGNPSPKSQKWTSLDSLLCSFNPQTDWFRWHERYQRAQEQRERYEEYRGYYDRYRRIEDHNSRPDDFFDTSHYRDGVWSAVTGGGLGWLADHFARQAEAVAWATDQIDRLPTGTDVDPTDSVHQPGNPGAQRILSSARAW